MTEAVEANIDLGSNIPVAKTKRKSAVDKAREAGKVVSRPKLTRIILEENDNIPPTGLFIGHNGRTFFLRPGEEVDVPDEVIGILNDAVISTPVKDPQTNQVVGMRDRMKYPYRRVA